MSWKNPFNNPPVQQHDYWSQLQQNNLPEPPVQEPNVFYPNNSSYFSIFPMQNLFNNPPVQQHDFWNQLQQSNLPNPPEQKHIVFDPHKLSDYSSFHIPNTKRHHKYAKKK
jgi:hypothetical protein